MTLRKLSEFLESLRKMYPDDMEVVIPKPEEGEEDVYFPLDGVTLARYELTSEYEAEGIRSEVKNFQTVDLKTLSVFLSGDRARTVG